MHNIAENRRRFLAHFASTSLGATLLPGVLWTRMQDARADRVTLEVLADALKLAGIELSEEERKAAVEAANRNLAGFEQVRKLAIPPDIAPPFHFNPVVPGIAVDRTPHVFRLSTVPALSRPSNLEDVAFWPVRHLAELVRTRQVTAVELTDMYLARLHRHNKLLNNVVTFLDERARGEARAVDSEIAAGNYKGPLHGIPWGAKDIIAVRGIPTTWGSEVFREQVFDHDATVVEQLRAAGAVLIAKLTTGELALGDQWFGGQTKSPWAPAEGSDGSSAGPASATAAGCVGFAIGSETGGSILSPSAKCGVSGLRPTFGRTSRHGVMALAWTLDRLGPLCRYAEDCAIVMQAIARPDGRDMSVIDMPFNWNGDSNVRPLKVGILQESFDEITDAALRNNAEQSLAVMRKAGVTEFIPVRLPSFPTNVNGRDVEFAAYFDEHIRAGRLKHSNRAEQAVNGRLIPASEYLQQQRARTMMMMELAKATSHVDVYVVGSGFVGSSRPPSAAAAPPRTPSISDRHFTRANLAGYPALNLPNGFTDSGEPTNLTLYSQPYREQGIIALAKAYQDLARLHVRRPPAVDVA